MKKMAKQIIAKKMADGGFVDSFNQTFNPENTPAPQTQDQAIAGLFNVPGRVMDASANSVAGKVGGVGEVAGFAPSIVRAAGADALEASAQAARNVAADSAEAVQSGIGKMSSTDAGLVRRAIETQHPADKRIAKEVINAYKARLPNGALK